MYIKQMHKKHTVQSVFLGKDNFSVTVYPNVDYAFIASLVVILDDVNREDRASAGSSWSDQTVCMCVCERERLLT